MIRVISSFADGPVNFNPTGPAADQTKKLGRFPFVRTDWPDHSRRKEISLFNQNSPARSVKS